MRIIIDITELMNQNEGGLVFRHNLAKPYIFFPYYFIQIIDIPIQQVEKLFGLAIHVFTNRKMIEQEMVYGLASLLLMQGRYVEQSQQGLETGIKHNLLRVQLDDRGH